MLLCLCSFMSCLFLLLPYMAEALLKDKARDRACCKEVPQQRHREVLDEGADKDGRQLHDWHAAQDDIEEDGCHKAHGRAHDKDRAGGTDDRRRKALSCSGSTSLAARSAPTRVFQRFENRKTKSHM